MRVVEQAEFEAALQAWLATEAEKISDVQDEKFLRAMFYGDFDAGKTDLTSKIVEALGGKAMLFYTDSGRSTFQKYPDVAANMRQTPFESFTQLKTFAKAHDEGMEGFAEFNTMVWDTASTGVYNTLRKLVKHIKTTDQRHPDIEAWTHYNMVKGGVRDLIEDLTKSKLNIIYTAHHTEPSNAEKEGRVEKSFAVRPNIPEATFKLFAQECNLMGFLWKEKEGAARQITFEGTKTRVAKSQVPGIDERTYLVNQVPDLIRKWKLS